MFLAEIAGLVGELGSDEMFNLFVRWNGTRDVDQGAAKSIPQRVVQPLLFSQRWCAHRLAGVSAKKSRARRGVTVGS